MKNKYLILFLLSFSVIYSQTPIYLDSTAAIDARVSDLLSRMTLDEKIGQMTQADNGAIGNNDDILTYHLGSILSGGGSDPSSGNSALDWANLYDFYQQKALQSRLMIPIIYGIDAVHGHSNVVGAVIFPHNIGMGAAGDSLLSVEEGRITATEMAATGIDWTFAPCVAVPRNERWGRTYEGFGETPELVKKLGSAEIKGLQNDSLNTPTSVVACAKHFLGDGGTTNGIDQGNTEISESELRAIHLPGYIEAINSGVRTIMASYSSWNGVKMHGNKYLLTDVLKTELGFTGFVVSDWAGINQLPGDYTSDVKTSINAGIDMVMVPNNYAEFFNILKSLVQQGEVSEDRIDDAVRRILRVKFELGLFEHPYADRSLLPLVGSAEHRAVARRAVRESMVLLKKDDNILPLPKSNVKILVAGEHADNLGFQCGGWTINWQGGSGNITDGTTILQGLQKIAPNAEFIYDADGNFADTTADYIIVVIGETPYAEGRGDRTDLTVDINQIRLVRKLRKLGIPLITILISGRPMIINPVLHNSDVFFASWLPGTEGDGIAQVLFGDYTPSGKLPATWPKSMSQIPINYGDSQYDPLFPYQYGITTFDNSLQGSSPIFQSGMITEDGLHIELAFNKSMNNPNNSLAQFAITKNGNENIETRGFHLSYNDKNMLVVDLNKQILKNDVVKLSYISGNLASEDNGILDLFGPVDIINYLDFIPKPHTIPGKVQAEDYTDMSGIQTENTSDEGDGLDVGWINDGDWLEYNCKLNFSGTFFINFRVASESLGGKIKFYVDSTYLFEQSVPVTGGWQNWTTISNIVDLTKGEFSIKLLADKGGFNINWFEFATISDVNDRQSGIEDYKLNQNYPNPFNPSTNISFALAKSNYVKLNIFNAVGEQIKTLVNKYYPPGKYEINYYPSNLLSSGVYFFNLQVGNKSMTKKMILIK